MLLNLGQKNISPFLSQDDHFKMRSILGPQREKCEWSEWWYVNFHDSNLGFHGCLVFKIKGESCNLADSKVIVALTTIGAGNIGFLEEFPADSFFASEQQCEVQVRNNYLRLIQGNRYAVHLESGDGAITVDLEVECLTRGFTFSFEDVAWMVPAPAARIQGSICYGASQRKDIRGSGYYEHSWGIGSERQVTWNWGEAANLEAGVSLVYAKLSLPGAEEQDMIIVSDANNFWFSLNGQINYRKMGFHKDHFFPIVESIFLESGAVTVDVISTLDQGHHWADIDIFTSRHKGQVTIGQQTVLLDAIGLWEYKHPKEIIFFDKWINRLEAQFINVKYSLTSRR